MVRILRVEAGSVRHEPPATVEIPVVPLRDVARWAIFVAALLFALIYITPWPRDQRTWQVVLLSVLTVLVLGVAAAGNWILA